MDTQITVVIPLKQMPQRDARRPAPRLALLAAAVAFAVVGLSMAANVIGFRVVWRLGPLLQTTIGLFLLWIGLRAALSKYHRLFYVAVGIGSLSLAASSLVAQWPAPAAFFVLGSLLIVVGACGVTYFQLIGLRGEAGRQR
jgi:predicted tellurium resistance membrane protein TerC